MAISGGVLHLGRAAASAMQRRPPPWLAADPTSLAADLGAGDRALLDQAAVAAAVSRNWRIRPVRRRRSPRWWRSTAGTTPSGAVGRHLVTTRPPAAFSSLTAMAEGRRRSPSPPSASGRCRPRARGPTMKPPRPPARAGPRPTRRPGKGRTADAGEHASAIRSTDAWQSLAPGQRPLVCRGLMSAMVNRWRPSGPTARRPRAKGTAPRAMIRSPSRATRSRRQSDTQTSDSSSAPARVMSGKA